ncbi:hypothetical protein [Salipiger abyssi]|uniref:Uncharacterized protein n=1 Tax=Salipiger abyssi TaxID=1250539 RepID=A0A1P8UUN3_9RHOB|nr:hypothetical protein [Salipiger abyssi]APZ53100.1 hypothetical protein Ga0080574_TMP2766 [Salipiger abyssi]
MTDDQLHAAIGRDLSNATSWDIAQICRNTGMEAYPHDELRPPRTLPPLAVPNEAQSVGSRAWNDYHDRPERSPFAFAVIAILALCGVAVLWIAVTDWLPALIKAVGWEG